MGHATEEPSCHQTDEDNVEQATEPRATLSAQASGPGCCSIVGAPAPAPVALTHGLYASGALPIVELAETSPLGGLAQITEASPQAPPSLGLPPLYTLLGSLLI